MKTWRCFVIGAAIGAIVGWTEDLPMGLSVIVGAPLGLLLYGWRERGGEGE
jgi:mannose/fructose/N-acetylgalactosamine-specific phosphotransferase system component IIC